jgi:hypothetical protein
MTPTMAGRAVNPTTIRDDQAIGNVTDRTGSVPNRDGALMIVNQAVARSVHAVATAAAEIAATPRVLRHGS